MSAQLRKSASGFRLPQLLPSTAGRKIKPAPAPAPVGAENAETRRAASGTG